MEPENALHAEDSPGKDGGTDPSLVRERARLVRQCARLTGDLDAAEDLAQETLLEAWRNAHKLRDAAGASQWLDAIARNVCLRWARRRGRELAALAPLGDEPGVPDRLDVEVELEREELAELLDRALALLPPETRDVLVHRYVYESPHAEIAARLGLSVDAVSMRISRGKIVLRRMLASELRADAAAYGLLDPVADGWHETRLWCADCGRRRLLMRKEPPPGAVSFRCPGCSPDRPASTYRLHNPVFARLVGELVRPAAIVARAAEWSWRYFGAGAETGDVACTRCGRSVRLRRYFRDRDGRPSGGLFADCEACGEQVSSSAGGLALSVPVVRGFRRDHPRTRLLPPREVEAGGVPAIVVRYEDALGRAGVDVVLARETLRVIEPASD